MADENKPTVDETPISPSRPYPERKNSLEKLLTNRPSPDELKQKNILPNSSAAPAIQAQQKELDKHMRADSLNEKIAHRPSPDELRQKNILPDTSAAPALQAQQKELQKHMRADSLNEKIAHRPSPEELIKEGVLQDDPRSPEEKYAEAIEDEYAKREGGA
ncbi:hypothetical protein CONLIGDRAFT_635728 [Coniochaeta ligniaria NRRL 30616]|uniref:RPEL repeat protein n=1 Tax=Coniochaeta ligniaria NRRL 30616 TaxID=1408157 RepID=A0A1J7IY17_9PEZI|nr:hypothetical protein CONLIGDRAFT_635728 [Coniochaeta ligniaria NRRL 30616]